MTNVIWHAIPDGCWLTINIFNFPTATWLSTVIYGGENPAKQFAIAKAFIAKSGEFFANRSGEELHADAIHADQIRRDYI